MPMAHLQIVGRGGEDLSIPNAYAGSVTVHGFVESLSARYQAARVAICPIHSGGGTRIKIIEAAAYRVPTIATSLGAEGLVFEDGKSIVLRDTAEGFATAIIELLADQGSADRMAREAYSVFKSDYERNAVIDKVVKLVLQVDNSR
jgi:glycosyltransferase involved in cell wall biosynthesis